MAYLKADHGPINRKVTPIRNKKAMLIKEMGGMRGAMGKAKTMPFNDFVPSGQFPTSLGVSQPDDSWFPAGGFPSAPPSRGGFNDSGPPMSPFPTPGLPHRPDPRQHPVDLGGMNIPGLQDIGARPRSPRWEGNLNIQKLIELLMGGQGGPPPGSYY